MTCRPGLWPYCVSRGGREDTGWSKRPGCGRFALAGRGDRLPGRKDAPAGAGLRQLGRKGGRTRDMHAPAVAVVR